MTMSDRTDKERKLEEDATAEKVKLRYLSEYPVTQKPKMSEKESMLPILAKNIQLDTQEDISRSPSCGSLSHSNISPTMEQNEQLGNSDINKRKLGNVYSYYETNEWLRANYPHLNRQYFHVLSRSTEELSATSTENDPIVVREDSDEEFIDVVTCDPDHNKGDESSAKDKASLSQGDKTAATSNESRITSNIRISSHDSGFISDEDTRLRLKVNTALCQRREDNYVAVKQVKPSWPMTSYGAKYKRGDDSPKKSPDDPRQPLVREPSRSASPPLSSSRVSKSSSPQLRPSGDLNYSDSVALRTESDSPKSIANRASSNHSGEDADSDVSERCRQGSACSDYSENSTESPYLVTNSESSSYAAARRMRLQFGPKLQGISRIIPSERSAFTKSDYYMNRWYRNETNLRKEQPGAWRDVRNSPERKSPEKLSKVDVSCPRDRLEDKPKYVPYRIPAVSRVISNLQNRISTNPIPEGYAYHNDSDFRSRLQQPSSNRIGTVNGIRMMNQFEYQLSGSAMSSSARKNYTAFPGLKRHYVHTASPGGPEARRVQEEELPHVSGSRAWESIYRSGEEARPGSEGDGEGEGEEDDSEDADDAALRLRVSVLLWALLGEARLRELGWPAEPERRVLWRAVDVCCSVAGAKSAAAVPLPQDHDCGDDMACFRDHAHRFLEVCAPTRDLWKRFGWASLTVDAVVAKIYTEDLSPCLSRRETALPPAVLDAVERLEALERRPRQQQQPSRPLSRPRHVAPRPPSQLPARKKRGRPAKVPLKADAGRVERVMLWRFLLNLLEDPRNEPCIHWVQRDQGIFRIINTDWLARLWGRRHGNPRMTYEKMARAMRTYYRSKVLQPVPRSPNLPRKLVYKFNPAVVSKVTGNSSNKVIPVRK